MKGLSDISLILGRLRPSKRLTSTKVLSELWGGGGAVASWFNTSDSGSRGRGFEPHLGRRFVSLSETYLPPKSIGNTQEAVAPSQDD